VLPLDPYFLGIWLAEGTSHNSNITTDDPEVKTYIKEYAMSEFKLRYITRPTQPLTHYITNADFFNGRTPERAVQFKRFLEWTASHNPHQERFTEVSSETQRRWFSRLRDYGEEKCTKSNEIFYRLKRLNVIRNKHIPEIYFQTSREECLRLLAGLNDGDGSKDGQQLEISQKVEVLAQDIQRLSKQLGYFVYARPKLAIATNSEGHEGTPVTRMHISGLFMSEIPFLLPRKRFSRKRFSLTTKKLYLPTIVFGKPPENKKRKVITWTDEMDGKLQQMFKKHAAEPKRWAKIRDDPLFASTAKENQLTPDNIRARCEKLELTSVV
jgi:replicative DNA helicase